MADKQHWEIIYTSAAQNKLSWYREHLEVSLQLAEATGLTVDAAILDVGGGTSTFVDDLLARHYSHITVLDISETALEKTRDRVGRVPEVRWIVGDITQVTLEPRHYDLWHDRAVFHFLTSSSDRAAYVASASHAVKSGGFIIVAAFSPDGPPMCSNLPVQRYDAEQLVAQFPDFRLIEAVKEQHTTPSGVLQPFTYVLMQLGFK